LIELNPRPGDRRDFIHKRIIGGIRGGLTGGFGGAIRGFATSGGNVGVQAPSGGQTAQLGTSVSMDRVPISEGGTCMVGCSSADDLRSRQITAQTFQAGNGVARHPTGITTPTFTNIGGGGNAGVAVMGRFGAGLVPDDGMLLVHRCLPGMVLGKDLICYDRGKIKNSERRWPKGRAPLLTGGERNCITRAARAAGKIQRTQKQLQQLGMLKTPTPRKAKPKPKMIAAPAGITVIDTE